MSGSSGIGRGRSRGLLMQKFLNKDVLVPSVESLEDKALNKLGIPPPGSTVEKNTESSSISSGDSRSNPSGDSRNNIKLQDSDIENRNITIVTRPLSCIGRGRGLSNPSSLTTSSGKSDKITENEEPGQIKKFVGRGRGLLNSQKECSNSTPSEVSNELKQMKISNDDKMTVSSEAKSQFENIEKPISKFRRREYPTQIKEPCNTRNDSSPSLTLSANYVKVRTTQPHIYQYHVSFAPPIDSRLMRIKIVQGLSESDLGVVKEARAFDGMNLYIPQLLKNKETIIKVNKPTDKTVVDVKVVFTNNVNFSECPMVYNVLFKRIENSLRMVKIGRDYFYPEKKIVLDRRRMEIWPGYVTSIQNFDGGLLLQCDVSHKVIRNDSVYDIMMEINKTVNNKGQMQTAAINQLLGQIVLTPHNNRNYRITDIDWAKNCLSEFDKGGEKISYRDYFKNTYGLQIRDLEQPMIVSKSNSRSGKNRGPRGSKEVDGGLVYLIPELCMLTGLTDDMIKDFRLMRELHEHCRVTPKKRHEALLEFVDNIYSCEEAKKLLGYWGITIEKDTVNINACKMNPEMIYFGNEASVSAGEQAEFKQALAHNKVIGGIRIENWILISPKSLLTKANGLLQALMSKSPRVGVMFGKPKIVEMNNDRTEEYLKELKRNVAPGVQLVVTILSAVREDRYNAIKKFCYVDCPVPSQVVLAQTLKEGPKLNSVAVNIALQINAKLGGELWAVKIPIKKFMVVGLDVWHDTKGRSRSVGAVVGSTNALCTRWFSKSHLQEQDKEIMYVLQSCMLSLLKAYFEENNFLPETIFMYRDGVSDGQLGYVQKTEIEQFFKVFESFSADYKPNMVYNVVQKRINTRLYVSDPKNKGQINNPNPGTIVDHTVTRANLYDFFLVSQSVRQGTVTPTHYVVLCDNSKYTPHQVQLMAYKTCHIYYNWPGTVRVPAPCMYAHKLAYMVGQNLKAEPSNLLCDRLFYL